MQWYEKFTDVDEVIPVSAKYGHGVEDIKEWVLSKLPAAPPYYPKARRNIFSSFFFWLGRGGVLLLRMNIYEL